jgi:phosphate transport system permease protein
VHFFTNFPSNLYPREKAGIKHALHGTVWLIVLTGLIAVPLGVSAAVYLQEYARENRLTRFIHLNISNLAGVPSIVYGILGLAVFVRTMALGRSVIAGALTMSLLILPVIIIAARESLSAVPNSIRLAAYALGATRWQVVRHHVLPAAVPGIMTGIILSLSRAIGEAAPLIMLGALNYMAFVPTGLTSPFTVLPIQIFEWTSRPQPEFHHLAAAAIIVLLAVLLTMNAVAIGIRMYQQKDRL